VLAVGYLEKHRILHRDIKPENFLITSPYGHIVLSDFDCAKRVDSNMSASDFERYIIGVDGTAEYLSPEELKDEDEFYCHKSDVYSLGLACLELFSGVD
ncbi:kinase-like domain-containing protein, partial [Epithele typhae]|uniref:kinase-like domain-containing protein n=1 Tax=Epithele typhae TaxID=378194 RepID=UPI00200741FB